MCFSLADGILSVDSSALEMMTIKTFDFLGEYDNDYDVSFCQASFTGHVVWSVKDLLFVQKLEFQGARINTAS